MFYIGVDPGASGGIAVIHSREDDGVELYATKTERETWDFLSEFRSAGIDDVVAVLEHVHSMPTDGVASAFKFGVSYGGLRAFLIAAGIPFATVTPQEWQKHFGLLRLPEESKSRHKGTLLARAKVLFSEAKGLTRAVSDALFLAEYARRHYPKGLSSTTK